MSRRPELGDHHMEDRRVLFSFFRFESIMFACIRHCLVEDCLTELLSNSSMQILLKTSPRLIYLRRWEVLRLNAHQSLESLIDLCFLCLACICVKAYVRLYS